MLTKVDKQAAAIASPSPFWLMVPCDPALKAINPKIKMKPPRDMCGMEWPEMNILSLSLKRSMRGPRIIAPERSRHHSFNSILHLFFFRCTRVRLKFAPSTKEVVERIWSFLLIPYFSTFLIKFSDFDHYSLIGFMVQWLRIDWSWVLFPA